MPRPRRIHADGALYYITCRGDQGTPVFADEKDLQTYLDLLSQYQAQHGFTLLAYALLRDQIHLCIQVGSVSISEIMHDLNSRYTKLHGKRYNRTGHLFQGRYRSVLVEKETYLAQVARYTGTVPGALASYVSPDVPEVSLIREQLERLLQKPVLGSPVMPPKPFAQPIVEPVAKLAADSAPAAARYAERPHVRRAGVALAAASLAGTVIFVSLGIVPQPVVPERRTVPRNPETAVVQPQASIGQSAPQLAMEAPVPQLNGTQWEIRLLPAPKAGEQAKAAAQQDILMFQDGQVGSQLLGSQGFSKSNYTVTRQQDGTVLWETMQMNGAGEKLFWRGEWNGEQMKGVISRHSEAGHAEDYLFVGVGQSGRTI